MAPQKNRKTTASGKDRQQNTCLAIIQYMGICLLLSIHVYPSLYPPRFRIPMVWIQDPSLGSLTRAAATLNFSGISSYQLQRKSETLRFGLMRVAIHSNTASSSGSAGPVSVESHEGLMASHDSSNHFFGSFTMLMDAVVILDL